MQYPGFFLLLPQGFQQPSDCFTGGGSGAEKGDELATYDGAGSVCLCSLEGGAVGDAKAYQTGIVQVHAIDAAEVFLLRVVE